MKRSEVVALQRKYRVLLTLRSERDRAERRGERAFHGDQRKQRDRDLRALVAEFPGAARELDVLSATALAARLHELEGLQGAPSLPPTHWIALITDYHRHVRYALGRRAGQRAPAGPWLSEQWAQSLDGARLMPSVWRQLTKRSGLSEAAIKKVLFLT